eukprot:1102993-Alexandrium_andersonii.AAC.1
MTGRSDARTCAGACARARPGGQTACGHHTDHPPIPSPGPVGETGTGRPPCSGPLWATPPDGRRHTRPTPPRVLPGARPAGQAGRRRRRQAR